MRLLAGHWREVIFFGAVVVMGGVNVCPRHRARARLGQSGGKKSGVAPIINQGKMPMRKIQLLSKWKVSDTAKAPKRVLDHKSRGAINKSRPSPPKMKKATSHSSRT